MESESCIRSRYIKTISNLIKKHPDYGGKWDWVLCAVAFNGSSPVSFGFNSGKTDARSFEIASKYRIDKMYPHAPNNWVSPFRHAEAHCLKNVKGSCDTIVVARIIRDGSFKMAKPCAVCEALIRESSVKTIIYSSDEGYFKREKTW